MSTTMLRHHSRRHGAVEARLLAENAELGTRLRRLGQALVRMSRDLARLRQDHAALERENQRLRALAERAGVGAPTPEPLPGARR